MSSTFVVSGAFALSRIPRILFLPVNVREIGLLVWAENGSQLFLGAA